MKSRYSLLPVIATLLAMIVLSESSSAQQYKLKQVTNMMGMKSETTIYVKGMRKRTEGGGFAGMPTQNLVTLEQCDLQRTITINDRKKLYYIAPFSKEQEEVIDEDAKPVKNKPVATQTKNATQKGGVVTIWHSIIDTGERKKMYGFTARRIWTTQKMVPSPDACMMKDSMIIKTDGWYIDLPQFNCPVRYSSTHSGGSGMQPLDCKDRFVTRRSGKGKLGFPLIEKRTMIMGNGAVQISQYETSLETLELSTAKFDSMLFEIPVGYTLAKSIEELEEKMDPSSLLEMYGNKKQEKTFKQTDPDQPKAAGTMRIGVLVPNATESLQVSELQASLVNTLTSDRVEAVALQTADDAKKYNCDAILSSNITKVKQASKIGGLLKAIKNADPGSASSYTIEAQMTLTNVANGAMRGEKKIAGKFEGTADGAVKKALEEGGRKLIEDLN